MAKASKVQLAEIKRLRKKLGVTNTTGHREKYTNHGTAMRYIALLKSMLADKPETPKLSGSRQVQAARQESSGEACVVHGCNNTAKGLTRYCPSCKKKREKGEIAPAIKPTYAEKSCLYCLEDFAPTAPRQKFCKTECRLDYKANGNHSKALNTPTPIVVNANTCGLVACDNVPSMNTTGKRKTQLKYCCEEHKVTANKAYNRFRSGKIDLEQLKSIVQNVYFRGEHKKQIEMQVSTVDDGIQRLPIEKFDAQAAFNVTMALCRQKAEDEYEAIIDTRIKIACDNLEFDISVSVDEPKMVCVILEEMFNNDNFNCVMDYDKEEGCGNFLIGWNKSEDTMSCAYCLQRIHKPNPEAPLFITKDEHEPKENFQIGTEINLPL